MSIRGKVALLGANGSVGRALSPLLGEQQVDHRVVGRNHLAIQVRFQDIACCEQYVWDPKEKAAFAEACAGSGTVVYLIGAPLWKFHETVPLIERALEGARSAGVERFLLVSSNWSYTPNSQEKLTEESPRGSTAGKSRMRRDQEDRVLAAHVPGVFATGVLRMADLYGPRVEASHLWSVFQAAKRGTIAHMLAPIDRPHEFVFVRDAARTIAALIDCDAAWSGEKAQAWNLGGAGVTSIEDMVNQIFAAEGKPPKYELPGKLLMYFVRSMNPYIREMREMRYLQEESLLLDDSRLAALLGGLEKTEYAEGIRQTLAMK
jgi:nucleoside-diphosphate-sugar epimerase